MTSKNLFFKLIWQDFKKRIWCPIIIFLVYFVATEIPLLKMLDWIKQYPNESLYGLKHYFANDFLSPNENCILLYLTVVVAAICAFCGYAYLHSRKQLDTYHSMPVKREVLFFTKYVEYDYTANLENGLDEISNGKKDWKQFLNEFWLPFPYCGTLSVSLFG